MSPDRRPAHIGLSISSAEQAIARRTTPTAKSLKDIIAIIGFPKDSVTGLNILDIGAGGSDATAQLLRYGANAYAVDPIYQNMANFIGRMNSALVREEEDPDPVTKSLGREMRAAFNIQLQSMQEDPQRYLAAYATSLPFEDNYFDIVFSVNCVISHLDEERDVLQQAVDEAIRVAKPSTQIQFAPFGLFGGESLGRVEKRRRNQAELLGYLEGKDNVEYRVESIGGGSVISRLVILKKEAIGEAVNLGEEPFIPDASVQESLSRQQKRQLERQRAKEEKRERKR